MYVLELWRYPVKSMRGERVYEAEVMKSGIQGDRHIVVVSRAGDRLITARTHPGLMGIQASLNAKGDVTIDGHVWYSPAALKLASKAAGETVQLVNAKDDVSRFDILPLLVATDGAIGDMGIDSRRLRPNIIVGGVDGQAERSWPGRRLQSGNVLIDVAQLRMRCVMTTFDPETLEQDLNVLKNIVRKAGGKLALDCSVRSAGLLRVGDPVELVAAT
jgi:MOSC domain-containing protein